MSFLISHSQSISLERDNSDREGMNIETEREVDGRWIAEAVDLPGVMAYGSTEGEAIDVLKLLASEVAQDPR